MSEPSPRGESLFGRVVVFDTETTGLDVNQARICEFGAVTYAGGKLAGQLRKLVHPGVPIPEQASSIHGVTDAKVADQPKLRELADKLVSYLTAEGRGEPPMLAGYNALSYDVPLFNAEFARIGHAFRIDPTQVIDPVVFVRWHLRHLRDRKLTGICKHLGISLERAHSADADAQATGDVLIAMLERGLIPQDAKTALAEQARHAQAYEAEFALWSYWIYPDRDDGRLRMGAGKEIGTLISEVDPGYLDWILGHMDDLTDATRAEFEKLARPR